MDSLILAQSGKKSSFYMIEKVLYSKGNPSNAAPAFDNVVLAVVAIRLLFVSFGLLRFWPPQLRPGKPDAVFFNGRAVPRPSSYPGGYGCGMWYYNSQGNVVNQATYYDDFGNPVDPPAAQPPANDRGGRGRCWRW
jgi:hypothetical protein